MVGGQINKGFRRFGVPGSTLTVYIAYRIKTAKSIRDWLKAVAVLLFIPILCMGYGTDSSLKKFFKKDWLVRIAYGTILVIPLGIIAALGSKPWWVYGICALSMPLAFSFRDTWLGRFRHARIGNFDILYEDVVRSLALGLCLVVVLL